MSLSSLRVSAPALARPVMHVLLTSAVCSLSLSLSALPVDAAEPAVKEANGRVIAAYDYGHLNSDDVFQFTPPPTILTQAPEVDTDAVGFTSFYTIPVADQFGARVFGAVDWAKSHTDGFDDLESVGLLMGGEAFWRDPEVGEVGLGTFYEFRDAELFRSDIDRTAVDRSEHTAGVRAFGKLFLDQVFGYGPIDLDLSVRFSDSDIDDNGSFSAERTYAARGGAKLYFADNFSVRLGGAWSRTNFGTTSFIEDRLFEADARLLLPSMPSVTLGGGFFLGTREEAPGGFQNYGRQFGGVGVSVEVAFPGAASLVELNRYYF